MTEVNILQLGRATTKPKNFHQIWMVFSVGRLFVELAVNFYKGELPNTWATQCTSFKMLIQFQRRNGFIAKGVFQCRFNIIFIWFLLRKSHWKSRNSLLALNFQPRVFWNLIVLKEPSRQKKDMRIDRCLF